jgi:hypothetical protein
VVANDNTLRVNNLTLQIEKSRFRDHFAKCRVEVFEHLDGTYAVVWKKRTIGRYDEKGQNLMPGGQPPDPRGLSLWGPGKRSKTTKGKRSASPSSPDVPPALGSLPSVALSSAPALSRWQNPARLSRRLLMPVGRPPGGDRGPTWHGGGPADRSRLMAPLRAGAPSLRRR